MILDGGLKPGDQLPSERQMLAELHVARGSLREAMRLLEAQEMVRVRSGPNGGPTVTKPSYGSLAEYFTNVFAAYDATVGNVMDARIEIQGVIARLAAQSRTEEDIQQLRLAIAEQWASVGTPRYYLARMRFHTLVAQATGNAVFTVITSCLRPAYDSPAMNAAGSEEGERRVCREYEQILDAIERHDGTAAYEFMRAHEIRMKTKIQSVVPAVVEGRVPLR
jgi:DNA-binding FadR family transcriptional regulator